MSYPFFLMCPPSQTHRHSSLLMKIERAEKLTRCDSRAMSKRATEKRNDDDDDASPGRTPQKTHSLISCCYIKKVFKIIFSPLHHRLSSALNSTSTFRGASFLSVSHVFCLMYKDERRLRTRVQDKFEWVSELESLQQQSFYVLKIFAIPPGAFHEKYFFYRRPVGVY